METPLEITFVSVILPLKFRGEISYMVPAGLSGKIKTGSRVKVEFGRKIYSGVVEKVERQPLIKALALSAGEQQGKTVAGESPGALDTGGRVDSGKTAEPVPDTPSAVQKAGILTKNTGLNDPTAGTSAGIPGKTGSGFPADASAELYSQVMEVPAGPAPYDTPAHTADDPFVKKYPQSFKEKVSGAPVNEPAKTFTETFTEIPDNSSGEERFRETTETGETDTMPRKKESAGDFLKEISEVSRQIAGGSCEAFSLKTAARISSGNPAKSVRFKEILEVEDLPAVGESEIRLWRKMAEYYMCTVGEVFKAAYPDRVIRQESVKARKTAEQFFEAIGKQDLDEEWKTLPEEEKERKNSPDEGKEERKEKEWEREKEEREKKEEERLKIREQAEKEEGSRANEGKGWEMRTYNVEYPGIKETEITKGQTRKKEEKELKETQAGEEKKEGEKERRTEAKGNPSGGHDIFYFAPIPNDDSDSEWKLKSNSESESKSNPERIPVPESELKSETGSGSESKLNPELESKSKPERIPLPEPELKPETSSELEPKLNSEPESGQTPESESKPEPAPGPETKLKAEAELKPRTETNSESKPKLKAEWESELIPKTGRKSDSGQEQELEAKSEQTPEPEAEQEQGPELKPEPERESEAKPELKPAAEPKPELRPEPERESKSKSEPEPEQVGASDQAEKNKTERVPVLSAAQREVFAQIKESFRDSGKPVLLQGVTGSGKTEVYIRLAMEQLRRSRNVLYMVPEIAVSKQLQLRLKKVFGERLLTFHSKQTLAEKSRIHKILSGQQEKAEGSNDAVIVLGTRSALFLPYKKLGLIIVDEEHDSSYKQTEPAPRYHARDAAIMLAGLFEAHIILGSATPSFESEYNCSIGRFRKIRLEEKYYGAGEPEVEIIDTLWAYKSRQMKGSFSRKLINEIKAEIARGGQVLIFRNRRSYAPVVECTECGCIPKCPHCNVYLSYHKYNNTLRCHYCEYTARFSGICPSCARDALRYKGTGTEKLEEELKELFPDSRIARFDADVAKSKRAEEQVLKDFAKGETDILVGTQMISKGFDFGNLNLVAVIQADTILGIQDFRGDERALQLFSQLMGRTGRRGKRGKLIIQTNQKDHPVLLRLRESARRPAGRNTGPNETRNVRRDIAADQTNNNGKNSADRRTHPQRRAEEEPQIQKPASPSVPTDLLLAERKEFNFPPFVRMVKVIVKHRDPEKLDEICRQIAEKLALLPCREFTGPFAPPIDKVRGEWIKCFYIKYARDARLAQNKALLVQALETLKGAASVLPDVDPL